MRLAKKPAVVSQHGLPPALIAKIVSRGEVDFVVSGLPPLIGTPNIEWLGNLPAEINSWVVFTGGLSSLAKEPEAGRALLKFLTAPAAVAVFKDNGLEPAPLMSMIIRTFRDHARARRKRHAGKPACRKALKPGVFGSLG